MQAITEAQLAQLNENIGEFFEIAEMNASGNLVEVAYYDSAFDGDDVTGYAVIHRTVAESDDICHVFDYIDQKVRCVEKRDSDDRPTIWSIKVDGPTLIFVSCALFERSESAIAHAMSIIKPIARARDHYAD